jgi:hypothetical protein
MQSLFNIYYSYVKMFFILPIIALGAFGLAACQTTNPTAPPLSAADAKVAAYSQKLAEYCTLAQVGVSSLKIFVHDAKVQQALAVAQPTIANFCNAPPQNVVEAVTQMAQLVTTINGALQKASPPGG